MGVLLRLGRGAAVAQVTGLAWCPRQAAQGHTCPLSLHVVLHRDTPRQCQQGTLGSRPSFLGDCCQVRNSKAGFLILVENGRCSSLGLSLDPELALCWVGHLAESSDSGDSGVLKGKLCRGCWVCAASGITAWRAARGVGLFQPIGEQQEREGGDTRETTEKRGGTRAALSRLHGPREYAPSDCGHNGTMLGPWGGAAWGSSSDSAGDAGTRQVTACRESTGRADQSTELGWL